MTTFQTHPAAIQHLIAYEIAHGVYRLKDFSLAIVDRESHQALVIEMTGDNTSPSKE